MIAVESREALDSQLASSRLVVVYFSASWSKAAKGFVPLLESFGEANDDVSVVSIDLSDDALEEVALDLGVSEPGVAHLYVAGKKAGECKPEDLEDQID